MLKQEIEAVLREADKKLVHNKRLTSRNPALLTIILATDVVG